MTDQTTIRCPKCGATIPLSKALTAEIEAHLKKVYDAEAARRLKTMEAEFNKKLSAEIEQRQEILRKQAEQAVAAELSEMRRSVAEARKQKSIIEALQRKLEGREKALEKEIARRVKEAERRAEQEIAARIEEDYRNRELELEKKLSDARKQATELRRKLEQGSRQEQGEIAEIELERVLKQAFPNDTIEPIRSGKKGADILQKVCTQDGACCGMILWESKQTNAWNSSWLAKLRSDQRRAKADLAVLVSAATPKNGARFTYLGGVWVTEFQLAVGVATALRFQLLQVAALKQRESGGNEKMHLLYKYLSGVEFRQRVEAIVEAFIAMRDDLERERNLMERQWAKREKQIHMVIDNVSGMYGDMQAIVGKRLPNIKHLELPSA